MAEAPTNGLQSISGLPQSLASLLDQKVGPLRKLSSDLIAVFTNPGLPFLQQSLLRVVGSSIAIEAIADTDPSKLLSDLQALGLQESTAFGRVVSGLVPISALDDIAALSSVRFARPAYKPITNAGSVTSQGDIAQRSNIARTTYGVNGTGITVGVLSDSYNDLGGAASDVTNGDLPPDVIVLQDLGSGGIDEGRAMLQIVRDVAPGAKLAFNTAFVGGQAGFANGIINLANPVASGGAGARVIVDDIIYFAEPFFQDGIVTQAVNQVTAGGVAYFSSAGNQARKSYESVFRPSTTAPVGFLDYTFHDFDPSAAVNDFQAITINGSFRAAFQWDQPFASASTGAPGTAGSQNDLDIYLFDAPSLTANIIAFSESVNNGGDPFELLEASGFGTGYLAIGKYNPGGGPNPTKIKYVDFGTDNTYQFPTNSSASFGHNHSANGQGVAAAFYQETPAFGTNPPLAEDFTSLGGTPILFDTAGNRLAAPIIRNQPAITAPDGVVTTLPSGGLNPFFGTSAAAPHAAGIAALIRQAHPAATNTQIYNALKNTAIDMNTTGYDFLTGTGLIRADAAIAAIAPVGVVRSGTAINDTLSGGLGSDTISGLAGNDLLLGLAGNDSLNGGLGADAMVGGLGNDIYVRDNVGDTITEASATGGIDTVQSSVTYALGANLENLTLTGVAVINGTGNGLNNILIGNGAANILNGGIGLDTLTGGLGNDFLIGGAGSDRLTSGTPNDADIFRFNSITERIDTFTDFDRINSAVIAGDDRDRIQVVNSGFNPTGGASDLVNGVLSAGRFVNGAGGLGALSGFRYFQGTGQLFFDSNGGTHDVGVGSLLLATLTNLPTFASMAGSITVI